MKLSKIGSCLLLTLCCLRATADTKTLSQWIDYFADAGINIFYSSDYLSAEQLNQPIGLLNNQLNEFNQYFVDTGLSLHSVDESVFVLRPKQAEQMATILIQAYDANNQYQIKKFQLTNKQQTSIDSFAGAIVMQQLQGESIEFTLSASGYYSQNISATLTPETTRSLHINLQPLPLALADILVSTSQINFNSSGVSQQTLSRQDLAKQLSFNHDPLRASESLAGTASNGISGRAHTRGGAENEVMVVFDNRELRNPYHFKDFYSLFSTINDSVVDAINFYSGVFPVQYGGRLSSVLDVQSYDVNALPQHEINLGLLTNSYTYRFNNNDHSYLMALRTGGQLFNDSLIEELTIHPEYDDGYFKAVQQINDHWQSSQHFLLSRDEIDIDQDEEIARAEYHDQNLWFQWAYDDLNSHQMNWQLYASRRSDRRHGWLTDTNSEAMVEESIYSQFFGIKFEHQWDLNNQLVIDYGLDVSEERADITSMRQLNHFSELSHLLGLNRAMNRIFELDQQGTSVQAFANARYQFNAHWTMDLGFHYQHQSWIADSGLSPRFNLAYFVNDQSTWRFGLGRHQQNQHIDELLLEDIEPSYFQPAAADLAVIEFNHRLNNGWHFRSEIYFKKYSKTQPYYENLFNDFHVLPDLFYDRIRLAPDDSEAAGAEFTLNGKYRNINWSASYTYSEVTDEFADLEISRSWNQRNAIKLNMSLPIKSWLFSMNVDFNNGWPLTRIIETDDGYSIDQRNRGHFKDFYQLSVKVNKSWQSDWGLWQIEMQLANALNIANPCCRNYQLIDGELSFEEKNGLPLVPNLRVGLSWD